MMGRNFRKFFGVGFVRNGIMWRAGRNLSAKDHKNFLPGKIFHFSLLTLIFLSSSCYAVCPVCVVFVGAGVGLSRWLGVDDVISGIWLGAFLAFCVAMTVQWLNKIRLKFYGRKILITLLYYGGTIYALLQAKIIGQPENSMWGFDKLILGLSLGAVGYLLANGIYYYLRTKNDGRIYFRGQRIVCVFGTLLLLTGLFL